MSYLRTFLPWIVFAVLPKVEEAKVLAGGEEGGTGPAADG